MERPFQVRSDPLELQLSVRRWRMGMVTPREEGTLRLTRSMREDSTRFRWEAISFFRGP